MLQKFDAFQSEAQAKTLGSILRSKVIVSEEKRPHNAMDEYNVESIGILIKDSINVRSLPSLERSTRIVLGMMKKLLQLNRQSSVALLTDVLNYILTSWCSFEQCQDDPITASGANLLRLIFESSVIKELYLSDVQPAANTVKDMLETALTCKKRSLMTSTNHYLEKLISVTLTAAKETKTVPPELMRLLPKFESFALQSAKDERHTVGSKILSTVVDFFVQSTEELSDTAGEMEAMAQLIDFLSNTYIGDADTELVSAEGKGPNSSTLFSGISTDNLASIFRDYEKRLFQTLGHLILFLLTVVDRSFVVLAPENIINACISNRSRISIEVLTMVVQGSPYHALIACRRFKKWSKTVPVAVMVQISRALLSASFSENRAKIGRNIYPSCNDSLLI